MTIECRNCGSKNIIPTENRGAFCRDCCRSDTPSSDTETASEKSDHVGVVGLGYVGTSLAAVFADYGLTVRGVDVDPRTLALVEGGECPIVEPEITERFVRHATTGRITASDSHEILRECNIIVVTVGTPLSAADPDLSAVEAATSDIGPQIKIDDTVIFRSTLPTGATQEIIQPLLDEKSELKAGRDYSLAFCPERMAEGHAYDDITNLPIVVGGLTKRCRQEVEAFWQALGHDTVPVSSPRAAEFTKLADNWWIDLNIALANEIALLSEAVGVDAIEVIHAANTLPKGEHNVNILRPGAGVGGSCLVKDPWFVANLADKHDLNLQTPKVSRQVNDQMPAHVVNLTKRGMGSISGGTVAILGYAFKAGTDDTRNTPSKEIFNSLKSAGYDVRVTDPYVSEDRIREETGVGPVRLPEALEGTDAIVIVTAHDAYRSLTPAQIISYVGTEEVVLIDGRQVFCRNDFIGSEVQYLGVGRGTNE